LNTSFFLTENSKLATSETPNINLAARAVNKKKRDQSTKVPVTNVKVPVIIIFQNGLQISNLPVKILEKKALMILVLPV